MLFRPRRFAFIRGLRRARRGPGGYCRHSGNQGTTGRPARAHDVLRKISLRTRLSKPGEPREGFPSRGTSPRENIKEAASDSAKDGLFKPGEPREGFPLARDLSSRGHPMGVPLDSAKDQAKLREAPRPREGFLPREAVSAPAAERTWDDVRDAIVILVFKVVDKAASSQRGLRPRHFCDKEDACTAGVTMDGPTDLCSANHRRGWAVAFQLL